jgi:hypothetical protein
MEIIFLIAKIYCEEPAAKNYKYQLLCTKAKSSVETLTA